MARHAWRVDKVPAKTQQNRNVRLDALRLRIYTVSDANWLREGTALVMLVTQLSMLTFFESKYTLNN